MKNLFLLACLLLLAACVDTTARDAGREEARRTVPVCKGQADCDAKWAAARTFVLNNADMKFQTYSSDFMDTYNPPDSSPQVAAQVNKEPQPDGSYKIAANFSCNNFISCNHDPLQLLLNFNALVSMAGQGLQSPQIASQQSPASGQASLQTAAAAPIPRAPQSSPTAAKTAAVEAIPGDISEGAAFPSGRPIADLLSESEKTLQAEGIDAERGTIITARRDLKLSKEDADCGKSWGIPFLMDSRATTSLALVVGVAGGEVRVRSVIGAVYRPGYGAPDKALNCRSLGTIEQRLANKIRAGLG